ncbi:TfoX/Sxy family protein [Geodermatophilaceae bacterium NBWT11]|nr:TfoX/Sxy family protein [Geodermatophilaceae bacterium NBWT11]
MAYDRDLADRLRAALPGASEKAMFGGLAFLVGGRMVLAANRAGVLMVRCDPARAEDLLARPGVTRMVMRDREMAGWLVVQAEQLEDEAALRGWVETGRAGAAAAR